MSLSEFRSAKAFVGGAGLAALLSLFAAATAAAHGPWVELKDCRLLANESNDADSFHVKAAGKEYIFRLYFVDAPETDSSFLERVDEQGHYFGLNRVQTLQLGHFAQKFTREKLAQPFTVRTCMQNALGRSKKERFYAFIGARDGDLSELLVANGLARVHGSEAKPVGLSSPEREWQKLERFEREAKQQKVGGWGAPVGRMTARLPRQPAQSGPDSFDAFFHPERLATRAETEAIVQRPGVISARPLPSPGAAAGGARLDLNTASSADLLGIPGVGPVLASRIITARPFKNVDELRNVKGIGPKKYEQIRAYLAGPTAAQ